MNFYMIESEYVLLSDTFCNDGHIDHNEFSTVEKAKQNCSHDSNCLGVYDVGCDGIQNGIALCYSEYKDALFDCFYNKIGLDIFM